MTGEQQIDPWDRGGSMSIDWVAPERAVAPEHRPTDDADVPIARPAHRARPLVAGAVAAIAMIVGAVMIVRRDDTPGPAATAVPDSEAGRAARPATIDTIAPVEPDLESAAATDASRAPVAPTETIVGTISWRRIDGDAVTLPSRVTGAEAGLLRGADADGGRWRSDDLGLDWEPVERVVTDRAVGGTVWSSRTTNGSTSLWWTDHAAVTREVEFDIAAGAAVDGYELIVERPDDRFPTMLGGDLYLPVTVRATLPWSLIAGVLPDRPYRYRIDVDGHRFGAVSADAGDSTDVPVVDLATRAIDETRVGLFDSAGDREWAFAAPDGQLATRVADVVAGLPTVVWTRWDGSRFVRVPMPWEVGDRVEFASVDGEMFARASAPGRRPVIWRTVDGEQWSELALPDEPAARTPLGVHQGDGEVIVTAFTERGAVAWVTEHAAKFQELLPIPGVEARAKGEFGFVAASPRSAPHLHVSPDGDEWERVDLSDLLGLDRSHWSVNIDVRPIDDRIYVIADRPEARTLLIGTVVTDD